MPALPAEGCKSHRNIFLPTFPYRVGGFSWGIYFAWNFVFQIDREIYHTDSGGLREISHTCCRYHNFSLAPLAPLCSLYTLSGSQVLSRCCWQSVCLSRPVISVVVWRELHSLCEVSIYVFSWALFFPRFQAQRRSWWRWQRFWPRVVPPWVGLEVPTAPPAGGCRWDGSTLFWQ